MNKFDIGVHEIVSQSKMSVSVKALDEQGEPAHLVIAVSGKAARVPSTTNSRLNMFPKVGLFKLLSGIKYRSESLFHARKMAESAERLLRGTHVVATINPEHKMRLIALTTLWNSIPRKPIRPLICNADERWLIMLHLHRELHRVDSHNLTKPICDWLQEIKLIENDKYVDCFPVRNADFSVSSGNEMFYITMRRTRDISVQIAKLVQSMF